MKPRTRGRDVVWDTVAWLIFTAIVVTLLVGSCLFVWLVAP